MSEVRIKTGHRVIVRRGSNEYELDERTEIDTAEIWIGGVCYRTDARDFAHAAKLVTDASRALLDEKLPFNLIVETTSIS